MRHNASGNPIARAHINTPATCNILPRRFARGPVTTGVATINHIPAGGYRSAATEREPLRNVIAPPTSSGSDSIAIPTMNRSNRLSACSGSSAIQSPTRSKTASLNKIATNISSTSTATMTRALVLAGSIGSVCTVGRPVVSSAHKQPVFVDVPAMAETADRSSVTHHCQIANGRSSRDFATPKDQVRIARRVFRHTQRIGRPLLRSLWTCPTRQYDQQESHQRGCALHDQN